MTTYTMPTLCTPGGLPLRFIDGFRQGTADAKNGRVNMRVVLAESPYASGYIAGQEEEQKRRGMCGIS